MRANIGHGLFFRLSLAFVAVILEPNFHLHKYKLEIKLIELKKWKLSI